jgi:hypothetical protein
MSKSNATKGRNVALALAAAKRLAGSIDGLQGIDFGWIYKGGVRTNRRGIRFHVKRKRSLDNVDPQQILPEKIFNIPTDVVEASYAPHAPGPTSLFDPIRPGISAGNTLRQTTGTLGLFVSDKQTGDLCMLSNWHVFCGAPDVAAGEEISQPGPAHLGSLSPRNVATLLKWLPLANGIDAAIAKLISGTAVDLKTLGTNLQPVKAANPKVGMQLIKAGVTSGVTRAIVDGVGGSYQIDYSGFGEELRWMDGFRLIADPALPEDEISLEGDSGAVWFEPNKRWAVGLHFGGEDGLGPLAEYALAHPLPLVLDRLNVTLS